MHVLLSNQGLLQYKRKLNDLSFTGAAMIRLRMIIVLSFMATLMAGCLRHYDAAISGSLDEGVRICFVPRHSDDPAEDRIAITVNDVWVQHITDGVWETVWSVSAFDPVDFRYPSGDRLRMECIHIGEELEGLRVKVELKPLSREGIYHLYIGGARGAHIETYFGFDEDGAAVPVDPSTIPRDLGGKE